MDLVKNFQARYLHIYYDFWTACPGQAGVGWLLVGQVAGCYGDIIHTNYL